MKIKVELDDRQVRDAFNRLLMAGTDMTPLMRDIGEHLLNTTRQRFRDQEDPEGQDWKPLSAVTLARKTKNQNKILTQEGDLRGSINYRAARDHVKIGSSRIYANTHQFGAAKGVFGKTKRGAPIPWGDIPARPYLGVSSEDRAAIGDIVNDYLVSRGAL